MTLVEIPGLGAGLHSVFEGSALKMAPVSGRLRKGAENIVKAARAVHEAIRADAGKEKQDGIDVKV